MPPEQADELNRRIGVYNSINLGLAGYLDVAPERLQPLRARIADAHARRACGWMALPARTYLAEFSLEPILRSDLARRRRDAEGELSPLEELADWAEAEDYETRPREPDEAVASGALEAQQDGDRVLIALGDYCRWAKEDIPVYPDLGPRVDVRLATERKEVKRNLSRAALIEAFRASPQARGWQSFKISATGRGPALG